MWGWTVPGAPVSGEPSVDIWVLDNGFHTDLAVPRDQLEASSGPLAQAVEQLPPGDWVRVGWGDARFYVDARPIHHRLPDGARAFLWPGNPSVVHLDPELAPPAASERAVRLRLSQAALVRLRDRLEGSLRVEAGRPVAGPPAQIGDGRFFMSRETFWVGHLCNHWTGQLLHAAGLPLRPVRSTFSGEIVHMARTAELDSAAAPH